MIGVLYFTIKANGFKFEIRVEKRDRLDALGG
jgi:hypothetical protein